MAQTKAKAFTLIELLIIVTIIGLLVAIILVNLQTLPKEAHDVNIQKFAHQLRNSAQLSYNKVGNYNQVCDSSDNTLSNSGEFGLLELALEKENPGEHVACFVSEDGEEFAASFPLVAKQGKYWCVQAAGPGLEIDCQITSASCTCP